MESIVNEFLQYGVLGIGVFALGSTFLKEKKEDKELYRQEIKETRELYKQELDKDREVYINSINSVVTRIESVEEDVKEIKDAIRG
jgi:hypothetical protein